MSFYRKYRPQIFSEIDTIQVRKTIESLLTKKKEELPHAYLFCGPRGTGKTTTARIIAKLFNCLSPKKNGEPCGECELCISIAKGTATDIQEIDAASNTGVDNIRDLKDKIMLAPILASWKVYIIDEVHMLSTGAFNALLKTLEEPPIHTVFILATTENHKVPDTIRSRCLELQFQKPNVEEIMHPLLRIKKNEKLDIDESALEKIAVTADGSFRDAIKLLEQASLLGGKVTIETVNEILSVPQAGHVTDFILRLSEKHAAGCIQTLESIQKDGSDMKSFFSEVIKTLQKQLIQSILTNTKTGLSHEELSRLLTLLHMRYIEAQRTNFPELPLQLAVCDYCQIKNEPPQTPAPVPSRSNASAGYKPQPPGPKLQPPGAAQYNQHSSTQPQAVSPPAASQHSMLAIEPGPLTKQKLETHWNDLVSELKSVNHSIAGILRSARPNGVSNGIVTIEAFYPFHKDKLSEVKTKEALGSAVKKLFGENVTIEVVLGKK